MLKAQSSIKRIVKHKDKIKLDIDEKKIMQENPNLDQLGNTVNTLLIEKVADLMKGFETIGESTKKTDISKKLPIPFDREEGVKMELEEIQAQPKIIRIYSALELHNMIYDYVQRAYKFKYITDENYNSSDKYEELYARVGGMETLFSKVSGLEVTSIAERAIVDFKRQAEYARITAEQLVKDPFNIVIHGDNNGPIQIGDGGNTINNGGLLDKFKSENTVINNKIRQYADGIINANRDKFKNEFETNEFKEQLVNLVNMHRKDKAGDTTFTQNGKGYIEAIQKLSGKHGIDVNAYVNLANNYFSDKIYNMVTDNTDWTSLVSGAILAFGLNTVFDKKITKDVNDVTVNEVIVPKVDIANKSDGSWWTTIKDYSSYILYGKEAYEQRQKIQTKAEYLDWYVNNMENAQPYAKYLVTSIISNILGGKSNPSSTSTDSMKDIVEKLNINTKLTDYAQKIDIFSKFKDIFSPVPKIHGFTLLNPEKPMEVFVTDTLKRSVFGRDKTEMLKTAETFYKPKFCILSDGAVGNNRIEIKTKTDNNVKQYIETLEDDIALNIYDEKKKSSVEEKTKKGIFSFVSNIAMENFTKETLLKTMSMLFVGRKITYVDGCKIILRIFKVMFEICGFDKFFNSMYYSAMATVARMTGSLDFFENVTNTVTNVINVGINAGGANLIYNEVMGSLNTFEESVNERNIIQNSDKEYWNRTKRLLSKRSSTFADGNENIFSSGSDIDDSIVRAIKTLTINNISLKFGHFLKKAISKDIIQNTEHLNIYNNTFTIKSIVAIRMHASADSMISDLIAEQSPNNGNEDLVVFDFTELLTAREIVLNNCVLFMQFVTHNANEYKMKRIYEYKGIFKNVFEQLLSLMSLDIIISLIKINLPSALQKYASRHTKPILYGNALSVRSLSVTKFQNQMNMLEQLTPKVSLVDEFKNVLIYYTKEYDFFDGRPTISVDFNNILDGHTSTFKSIPFILKEIASIVYSDNIGRSLIDDVKRAYTLTTYKNMTDIVIDVAAGEYLPNVYGGPKIPYEIETVKKNQNIDYPLFNNIKNIYDSHTNLLEIKERDEEKISIKKTDATVSAKTISLYSANNEKIWFASFDHIPIDSTQIMRCKEDDNYYTFRVTSINEYKTNCLSFSFKGMKFESKPDDDDSEVIRDNIVFEPMRKLKKEDITCKITIAHPSKILENNLEQHIRIKDIYSSGILEILINHIPKESIIKESNTSILILIPPNESKTDFYIKLYLVTQFILMKSCHAISGTFGDLILNQFFNQSEINTLSTFAGFMRYSVGEFYEVLTDLKEKFKRDVFYALVRILARTEIFERIISTTCYKISNWNYTNNSYLSATLFKSSINLNKIMNLFLLKFVNLSSITNKRSPMVHNTDSKDLPLSIMENYSIFDQLKIDADLDKFYIDRAVKLSFVGKVIPHIKNLKEFDLSLIKSVNYRRLFISRLLAYFEKEREKGIWLQSTIDDYLKDLFGQLFWISKQQITDFLTTWWIPGRFDDITNDSTEDVLECFNQIPKRYMSLPNDVAQIINDFIEKHPYNDKISYFFLNVNIGKYTTLFSILNNAFKELVEDDTDDTDDYITLRLDMNKSNTDWLDEMEQENY